MIPGTSVAGQWTNKTQGLCVVASGIRIDRILERAGGYRCGKGRHENDSGDRALEIHDLATLPLAMLDHQ
ncbi:MAG: hypothetical protein WBE53_02975 [Pseudolabrys sp.]